MNHIGQESKLSIGGKVYTFSRFERHQLRAFLEWANNKLGCPLQEVKKIVDGFPPAMQTLLVNDALERKRNRQNPNSEEIQALMSSQDGAMKLIYLLFQKHHPELTDSDIEKLYDQALLEHGENFLKPIMEKANGVTPVDEAKEKRKLLGGDAEDSFREKLST